MPVHVCLSLCRACIVQEVSNLHYLGLLFCDSVNQFLLILLLFSHYYFCCYCSYFYCYSLVFSSPGWKPLCLYRLRLDLPGPGGAGLPSGSCTTSRDCTPWGHSYVMLPTGVAYLTPRASPPRSFPGMLISLGHGPGNCFSRGCVPRAPLSCFDHQTMAPLCFLYRHCNISARMV